jgi:hypothetical protein
MEEGKEVPPGTAGADAPTERCGICGRFLSLGSPEAVSDFTPDSAYTYERTEWFHKSCVAKGMARSSFKMDFFP